MALYDMETGEFEKVTHGKVANEKSAFGEVVLYLVGGDVDPAITLYPNMGENVTLPCANLVQQNASCPSTTWNYGKNGKTVEMVGHGMVKNQADRLSVGFNCSLMIHGVRAEDVGQYSCRQYPPGGGLQIGNDYAVYLSLLTISSSTLVLNPGASVTLACYLSKIDGNRVCTPSPIWLDEDGSRQQSDSVVQGSQSPCNITLTVTLRAPATSRRFRCRLIDLTNQTLKETSIYLSSNASGLPQNSSPGHVTAVAVTAGAILFLIAVTIIIISFKKREKKKKQSTADMSSRKTVCATSPTQHDCDSANKVHKDQLEHITYASINLEKNPSKTIIQANDAVTYASVGVSSGRGTAPDNLNDLYATVNK